MKFKTVGITIRPDFSYVVRAGGICVFTPSTGASEIIHWFSPNETRELKKTWNEYDYFIDEEGDVSREAKHVDIEA
jgi:hypothetical protein